MSRPSLLPPPSVEELDDLARQLAVEVPAVLPAFVWSICRSSRASKAFRTSPRPSGVHLAMLQSYPAGAQLISSSHDGAEWLRKWTQTSAALDELIPPIFPGDQGDKSRS